MAVEYYKNDEEDRHFLLVGKTDIKSVKSEGEWYKIEVYPTGRPDRITDIMVTCLCPGLAELVQKSGNGDAVAEDVSFTLWEYNMYENTAMATFALKS